MRQYNNFFVPSTYRESRHGTELVSMSSELFKERKIFLIGAVDGISMGILLQSLMCLDSLSDEPIDMFINSNSGEVSSGCAVYQYIMDNLQSELRTYCIGTAASMGSVLYLAGKERFMYEGTTIMIHDPSSISVAFENPTQLKDRLEILDKSKNMICNIIAERTGHTFDEITEITKKDAFFGADEAVEFGLATKVIGKERRL